MRHVSMVAGGLGLLGVGALIGAVTAYQVFDIRLTEGSGDLLGAAFGAALAVGGGAWLSGLSERRRSRNSQLAMHGTYRDLIWSMQEMLVALSLPLRRIDAREIMNHEQAIVEADIAVYSRLSHMIPAFQSQGLAGVHAYNQLVELAPHARAFAERSRVARDLKTDAALNRLRHEMSLDFAKYQAQLHRIIRSLS